MPSKYGFGNTRKKSPYKMGKASYGMDQKNPIKKNGDKPKLTTKDLGNLVTKGAKVIQKGIKSFSDSELMNVIKRNADAFSFGKLKPGQKYRSKEALDIMSQSTGVDMHDITQRADSTRAAINILRERKNK